MDRAFARATPECKDLIAQLKTALGARDFPSAFQFVQTLSTLPDASKAQRLVVARSMLSIQAALQTAKSQGDAKAAAAIDNYRRQR